eukprot:gene1980-34552_t
MQVVALGGFYGFDYLEEALHSESERGSVAKLEKMMNVDVKDPSIAGIIYTPLNISYKSTSGNGAAAAAVDGNAAAANKRIEFRGFAGLVSAPLIMLLSTFIALLVFVLEVPAVPGVGLVCVQVACFLEVSTFARRAHADTPINLESNKPDVFYSSELNWPAAVAWFLFATQCFYATGHQASLVTIQWTSGLVGLKESDTIISGILVAFNTASAYILFGIGLPLLDTWRDYRLTSRSSKEQRLLDQYSAQRGLGQLSNEYFLLADHSTGMYRQIFKTILAYSICISMQTVTSVLAASILRRHLMVWKIFAPRVIFDCVALIFTDVGLGVGFIFVIWLHRAFKKVVEHETTQFAKQS